MTNYGVYTHPEDVKEVELDTVNERDDAVIARLCIQASRDFEGLTNGRVFYPYRETKYYDHPENVERLELREDLLEIDTFTTQNTGVTMTSSDYVLKSGERYNDTPYDTIEIELLNGTNQLNYSGTTRKSNAIDAYWGYVEKWDDNAWSDSTDTLSGSHTNVVTSLTVTDADGADVLGFTPRFKKFQLLKVNNGTDDDEYMFVTAVNPQDNTLTVVRGVNGTTAVAFSGGETVYIFQPTREIADAVRRLTAWLYRQKNTSRPDLDRPVVTPGGIVLPSAVPADIVEIAMKYRLTGVR